MAAFWNGQPRNPGDSNKSFTAQGWGVEEAGGMARSRGAGLKWLPKGLFAALSRQVASTGRAG